MDILQDIKGNCDEAISSRKRRRPHSLEQSDYRKGQILGFFDKLSKVILLFVLFACQGLLDFLNVLLMVLVVLESF